jgi:hypothetical protein
MSPKEYIMIKQNLDIISDIVTAVGDPSYAHEYMLDFFCSINHCYMNEMNSLVIKQHAGRLRALAKLVIDAGITLDEALVAAKDYFWKLPGDDLQFVLNLVKAYYGLYNVKQ